MFEKNYSTCLKKLQHMSAKKIYSTYLKKNYSICLKKLQHMSEKKHSTARLKNLHACPFRGSVDMFVCTPAELSGTVKLPYAANSVRS